MPHTSWSSGINFTTSGKPAWRLKNPQTAQNQVLKHLRLGLRSPCESLSESKWHGVCCLFLISEPSSDAVSPHGRRFAQPISLGKDTAMLTNLTKTALVFAGLLMNTAAYAQTGFLIPATPPSRGLSCPTGNCGITPMPYGFSSYTFPKPSSCPGGYCPPNPRSGVVPASACVNGVCAINQTLPAAGCRTGNCRNVPSAGVTVPSTPVTRIPSTTSHSVPPQMRVTPVTPSTPVYPTSSNSSAVRTRMFDSSSSPFYP